MKPVQETLAIWRHYITKRSYKL